MIIAVLNNILANIDSFVTQTMTWADWVKFLGGAALAGAIALRLFLDQSITKYGNENVVPPPPGNPSLSSS
ncbi:MAG: hypothetical protein ACYSUV_00190 [Planctomycetota bacterium]|jgi:hypothetical protein